MIEFKSQYAKLVSLRDSLNRDYSVCPSRFLKKQIDLIENKIIKIDSAINSKTNTGGNYPKAK